ncbi:MAG: hypothetical protein R3Y26_07190 [Rikenellaceae bacterium]
MENKAKLLDCTLRDGGYLNDWNFGYDTIMYVFNNLVNAQIDYIEVGFLDDRCISDMNRTIQPDTCSYNKLFEGCNKGRSKVLAMIDYGTCALENIQNKEDNFIDTIRGYF